MNGKKAQNVRLGAICDVHDQPFLDGERVQTVDGTGWPGTPVTRKFICDVQMQTTEH